MFRKNWLFLVVVGTLLAFVIFNPVVFAKGKEGLAHIVQEHSQRIAQLEELIVSKDDSDNTLLSTEVKQALLKEVENKIISFNESAKPDGGDINITSYEIEENNNIKTLKIYVEGNYDWTGDTYSEGVGRNFARAFIFNFNHIAKMYGIDLNYEFYENNKRITVFTVVN